MKTEKILSWALTVVFAFGFVSSAYADEAKLLGMIETLQKQVGQMQKTIDWQGQKIKDLQNMGPESAPPVEVDFEKGLKDKIGDYKWLNGLKFKGDFRLRYEAQQYTSGNPSESNDLNRFRFRLRYGFIKDFGDATKVGFRLASGNAADITSTNQTFDSNFSGKTISIDQAWAEYTPKWAQWGPIKEVKFVGGKFENPLYKRSTFLVWDSDVNPEGAYESIKVKALKMDDVDVDLSGVFGQFILEEGGGTVNDDAEVYAFSGGLHTKLQVPGFEKLQFNNYLTWLNYSDYTLPGNWSRAQNNPTADLPLGPAYLAADGFSLIDLYNEIEFQIDPLPKTKLWFQYVENIAEKASDSRLHDQNDLWGLGIKIGKAKKKNTWEAGYAYGNIEANAVPGNFNDSDFGHADTRGSVFKLGYALTDNLVLNGAAFFTNAVSAENYRIDQERRLFQLDFVWKF